MVTNVTSLTGNGLKDWWVQRATAVFFAVYTIGLLVFILVHSPLHYAEWQGLFHSVRFKLATIVALVMLTLHTWIGIWTVTTDYLNDVLIRLSVQLVVMLLLLVQFIYGLMMVWGQ